MAGIAALAAAYVLSQFYRSFLAVLTPALATEIGADATDLSLASGTWFVVFALMQFAIGVWLDRYGPRRTASFMLALGAAGGAFFFASATAPWMVVVAMGLIGLGCAPILMSSVFIFAHRFSPARLAVLTSWLMALGMMGNVVGATPLAAAADLLGWRQVLAGFGGFTFAVATAIFIFLEDPPTEKHASATAGFSGYLELLRLRDLWPIFPLSAVTTAAAVGIRGLWAGPYLIDVYGAQALQIGQVTLFMALAMAAGSFLYGPLDTLLGTRKWIVVTGNTIAVVALAWFAAIPVLPLGAVVFLLVTIGLCSGGYGILLAHSRAFFPPHLTGRGVTLLNFFSIGGIGAMQFATGAVVAAAAVPAEPVVAYRSLFLFYAVVQAFALLIYLGSRDVVPERLLKASAESAGTRS